MKYDLNTLNDYIERTLPIYRIFSHFNGIFTIRFFSLPIMNPGITIIFKVV